MTVLHESGCSCPRCRARELRDERTAAALNAELRAKLAAAALREQDRRRMRKVPVQGDPAVVEGS